MIWWSIYFNDYLNYHFDRINKAHRLMFISIAYQTLIKWISILNIAMLIENFSIANYIAFLMYLAIYIGFIRFEINYISNGTCDIVSTCGDFLDTLVSWINWNCDSLLWSNPMLGCLVLLLYNMPLFHRCAGSKTQNGLCEKLMQPSLIYFPKYPTGGVSRYQRGNRIIRTRK